MEYPADLTRRHAGHLPHRTRIRVHIVVFTRRTQESWLLPSMGSTGDCFDAAMVESFWARIQVELLNRNHWKTRVELTDAIFRAP